jgi:Carboxypeptidase regulatory-like domain
MHRSSRLALTVLFGMILLLMPRAWAQENAIITGTVVDSTGAVVPNVEITLTNTATGQVRTATTDVSGVYIFPSLGVGHYTLTATGKGFHKFTLTDIVVNVAQTLKEDVTLTVGSESQTVTVEADVLQVQAQTNEISNLISGAQVTQLGINGRNITQLAVLGMGVSNNLPGFNGVNALTSGNGISFNGTRSGHNIYLLDGGELNDRGCGGCFGTLPSLDAINEFQTLNSNYGPDYGIGSGGTILMVVRSGSHDFHGGLWYFNRNEVYDANNYFTNFAGQARPKFRLNLFGGNIGGPLFIPHIYNNERKRTFFFVNEEWRRLIQGSTPSVKNTIAASNFPVAGQPLIYTVPSNGTIPVVPTTSDPARLALYTADGLTAGQPFPGNKIPANLMDPNAVLMMNAGTFPAPNLGSGQYISSIAQPTNVREDLVRIDHAINSKLQLMGHYVHDNVHQTYFPPLWGDSSYPTVGTAMYNPSWAAVIKLTQTISPNLLNETAFNYNGNLITLDPVGVSAQPSGWSATSFFPAANNFGNRMPEIQLGAPYGTTWSSSYFPWRNSFNDYQVRDDLSWNRRLHQFKFGFSYMRAVKNQQLQANTQGTAQFTPTTFSGDSYINFLLGDTANFTQLNYLAGKHWVNNTYSGYVNDNYRIIPNLTLNLGIRFDGLPHAYERFNQFANFVAANYNTSLGFPLNSDGTVKPGQLTTFNGAPFYLNGISLAGVNGFPRGNVQNRYNTWQPRVGFAYDINGSGKTVVRGGFGMFFERVQGNDVYNAAQNPPFAFQPSANNVYFSNPSISAITGPVASAGTTIFPSTLTNLDFHYTPPGTAQFSLGIQRQLAQSLIAVVQYVGTTGWHQNNDRAVNTLPLTNIDPNDPTKNPYFDRQGVAGQLKDSSGNALPPLNANLYRQFPGFSSVTQEENASNFNYNGFQAGLRMENRHGLTLQLAYTWSHALDAVSGDLNSVSNPFNIHYDYASGALDRRHIFNVNYIYALPSFAHGNALQRTLLGGWSLSGVVVAQSGSPVNPTFGTDVLGLGGGTTNRPNVVSNITYPKTRTAWFNKSAFAAPVAPWLGGANQGFGNAQRNAIVGPGNFNFNTALFKSIPFTAGEGTRLELRFESFNTFNHTQFSGLDTAFTDGNFGQVTSSADARRLQLGGKFYF